MGIEKKTTSVRLDEETLKRLKFQAEKENRNVSNLIETIIKQYLDDHKIEI